MPTKEKPPSVALWFRLGYYDPLGPENAPPIKLAGPIFTTSAEDSRTMRVIIRAYNELVDRQPWRKLCLRPFSNEELGYAADPGIRSQEARPR